jgi:hypothetical protein
MQIERCRSFYNPVWKILVIDRTAAGMASALGRVMTDRPRQDLTARAFTLSQRMFVLYPRLAAVSGAHAHIASSVQRDDRDWRLD